ncbi:hypothetical protein [Pseudomonas sp. NPDC090208]|uniref:hypothetical protein n=1 Tax=Pseudomonas sp. NPDC090208 TaxID=3364478 RepID=UPI0037F16C94
MAHHLAELMDLAENGEGELRQIAEKQAAELIIKLWANRRSLPASVDPMGGQMAAIELLTAMQPTANPWARFRRTHSKDDLLHEMFGVLTQIVMSGILLTRPVEIRPIEDAEWDALPEDERFLIDQLGRWKKLLATPVSDDLDLEAFYSKFINDEVDTELEERTGPLAEEEKDGPAPTDEQRVILSNLETFQSKLAAFVDQYRNSLDSDDAIEEDEVDDLNYGKSR